MEDWITSIERTERTASRVANVLRRIGLKRVVWSARQAATIGLLRPLHLEIIHRMRTMPLEVTDLSSDLASPSTMAVDVCTESRRALSNMLELPEHHLHCCLKLLLQQVTEDDSDKVATWVRSTPHDERSEEQGEEHAHKVADNTVWSALMGRTDGKTDWEAPWRAFACNNLPKHEHKFRCSRVEWSKYYKSTLVVPIRFPENARGSEFFVIGFLAFDSPKTGVFRGFPDIFDFVDRRTDYYHELDKLAAFHLAGILVDTMALFLSDLYSALNTERGGNRISDESGQGNE